MRREGVSTEYMHIVFSQGRHESNMIESVSIKISL